MAYITITEGLKLTTDDLQKGVHANLICTDDFLRIVPFKPNVGGAFAYRRVNALGDAQVFDTPSTVITAKSATSFTVKTGTPRVIIGEAEIEHYISEGMSDYNDQFGIQIAGKMKAVTYQAAKHLIVGESDIGAASAYTGASCTHTAEAGVSGVPSASADELDGLISLTDPAQVTWTAVGGAAFGEAQFDALVNACKLRRPDCFVTSGKIIDAYKAKLRAAGGIEPAMFASPGFGQGPVLHYDGIPVLKSDWVPTNLDDRQANTDTTLIFAVCLGPDGFHGISKGPENIGLIIIGEPYEIQDYDGVQVKVKAYWNFVNMSKYATAMYAGITV